MKYCKASDFQKTVGQLIAGLKIQQEELSNLRGLFQELDKDRNGSLSRQELARGLRAHNIFLHASDLIRCGGGAGGCCGCGGDGCFLFVLIWRWYGLGFLSLFAL